MWPEYEVYRQGGKKWKKELGWVQMVNGFIGSAQNCRHNRKGNEFATNSRTKNIMTFS